LSNIPAVKFNVPVVPTKVRVKGTETTLLGAVAVLLMVNETGPLADGNSVAVAVCASAPL
jgi:hypothetical protein